MGKNVVPFQDSWNNLSLNHCRVLEFKVMRRLGERFGDEKLVKRDQVLFIVVDARVLFHYFNFFILTWF